MKQTWKTPEKSRLILGVNGERARNRHLLSPCVIQWPRGTSGLAARPLSAWTPSPWSGTTQATWGAPPLTKRTRRAHTTAHCQVTAWVPSTLESDPFGYVFSPLATRPALSDQESSLWLTLTSVVSCALSCPSLNLPENWLTLLTGGMKGEKKMKFTFRHEGYSVMALAVWESHQ